MKLNGKLSQRCWQEVIGCSSTKARLKSRKKHCVLDDTMGMQKLSSFYNFFDALAQRRDCSRGATSEASLLPFFTSSFTSES